MSKTKSMWKKFQSFIKPYKMPIRAFLGWCGGIGVQLAVVGADEMMNWTPKRWALGLFAAAIPGITAFMRGGENNPSDEELFEKVQTVKAAKKKALGVETTGEIPILPKP